MAESEPVKPKENLITHSRKDAAWAKEEQWVVTCTHSPTDGGPRRIQLTKVNVPIGVTSCYVHTEERERKSVCVV